MFYTANITVSPSSMSTLLYNLVNYTCVGTGSGAMLTVQGKLPLDT